MSDKSNFINLYTDNCFYKITNKKVSHLKKKKKNTSQKRELE